MNAKRIANLLVTQFATHDGDVTVPVQQSTNIFDRVIVQMMQHITTSLEISFLETGKT